VYLLAIAAGDAEELPPALHPAGCCVGHSSCITALDWSADGEHVQSNAADYEILCVPACGVRVGVCVDSLMHGHPYHAVVVPALFSYWVASSATKLAAPVLLRDESWHSWSCPLGWPVQVWGVDERGVACMDIIWGE
jgi:hypothetical protein